MTSTAAKACIAAPESNSSYREPTSYTTSVAISMALYACLFFVLAFCGPYVLPALTLLTDSPLADREVAASQLLLLHDTVWVAIPVLFLGAVLFSLLFTRRIADAVERLGQSARIWSQGSLSHRIKFRSSDRLDGLARALNNGWDQIGQGLVEIRHEVAHAGRGLAGAGKALASQGSMEAEVAGQLQAALGALENIEKILCRFGVRAELESKP